MGQMPVIDILEARYPKKDAGAIDKWYDEVHFPILFRSNKLRSIARYKVIDSSAEFVRYFIICRYDSENDFEVFKASREFREAGKGRPDPGGETHAGPPVHCELVKEWVK
jgi:hypothetical protein